MPSVWQLVIILAVVLLLFGGRGKISSIMGDFGKGLRNFKTGLKGPEEEVADESGNVTKEEEPSLANNARAKKAPTKKKGAVKKARSKKKAAGKKVSKKK